MLPKPGAIPNLLWDRFVQLGQPERLPSGRLLWEPGDPRDDQTFLVVRGLARIFHTTRKSEPITLLAMGPGGLLGHHPELKQRPHSTGAEALCESLLLCLPAAVVDGWLGEDSAFGDMFVTWLHQDLSQQLASTYERLEVEHEGARARVARTLLALDRQALLDRLTRQQIADLSNLTLETVVRTLSSMLREGILQSSHFCQLSSAERGRLTDLLEPNAAFSLPYS